jgi:hypothetical protein
LNFEQLLGIGWTKTSFPTDPRRQGVSCVGVVNVLFAHLFPLTGDWIWSRIWDLPRVAYHQLRPGDMVLWQKGQEVSYSTGLVSAPRHIGVILNPADHTVLHSGYARGVDRGDAKIQLFRPWLHIPCEPCVFLRGPRL